jgi:hypothetical protein
MARPSSISHVIVAADVSINAGNITAATCLDVEAEVLGLRPGFPVQVWSEELTANVGIVNAFCSDKDELTIRLLNSTGIDINPAAVVFRVVQR